jgi:hypothetical protein
MHRNPKADVNFVSGRAACRVRGIVARAHGIGTAAVGTAVAVVAVILALGLASCGRSSLNLAAPPVVPVVDAAIVVDRPPDLASEPAAEALPDAPPEAVPDLAPEAPRDAPLEAAIEAPVEHPPGEVGPACVPHPETCNGVDDDCNGEIDDNLPPIPCPDGGDRYCVSGQYSECPRRCEVCVPGSERECFTTYCTYWGEQACASDGRSFGACQEAKVPFECQAIANQNMKSAALEQCCIDHGFCCLDEFNLDHDDSTQMLGRCDSVVCGP